uniref:DNA-directed RNA polymerases I and III subunit RPAC1 n=1 Tax=Albugo laibachii Nc14 TaxID=890382 RepID=F0WK70_9STRA|nr:DNAdirected RNA polymerase I and III subunit RPAC1 p [Albugo laibachii Nc14]|eukprot:CCA21673.1 DNAdirected RNA polymerase I and III subunit RPAC1 p [Albugo laibachii Nc14]
MRPHKMTGGKSRILLKADAPHMLDADFDPADDFLTTLTQQIQIQIKHLDDQEMEFDLIGVDPSIANALRRILLSEVPTMAIEHVYIWNNSSIIQDEVLAHRLGLIPLLVDPREFQHFPEDEEAEATDENTIVFKLDVTCRSDPNEPENSSKASHSSVYSRDLEWVPQGNQEERFTSIRPVSEDILIAKLRPGQSIALEAHCRKGIGRDHAKFSPVSTASYRLLPRIEFTEPVVGEEALELAQNKCVSKVFDIEDIAGLPTAIVSDSRKCTMCRECIRAPGWDSKIQLGRQHDHFIFSIESAGMFQPQELLSEALTVLMEKCSAALEAFQPEDVSMDQDEMDSK